MLASTFGQPRYYVLKPDNSHLSDGPLIILSLQSLLMGIKNMFLWSAIIICYNNTWYLAKKLRCDINSLMTNLYSGS